MANPANLTINELSANGSVDQPAAQSIDTDGTINCAVKGQSERLIFEVVNSAANAITLTFKAGVNPPAIQSRDLAVTVAASGGADSKIIGPFESSRFAKADGSIDVAFLAASGSPDLAVRVYRLPKQI